MLDLHLFDVFLGAQVHRPQRLALAFQAVYIGLDRLGIGHFIWVGGQPIKQLFWRCLHLVLDALRGIGHGFARGIGARLGAGTGLAGLACCAFCIAFPIARNAQGSFGFGQLIGGNTAAIFGLLDGVIQFVALGGNFIRRGAGRFQLVLGLRLARGQFGAAGFRRLQPVAPTAELFCHLLGAPCAGLALAAQFIMGRAFGQHGHARRLDRHANIFDTGARFGQIFQIIHRGLRLGQLRARR